MNHDTAIWLDNTFLELGVDMLVVLTLREEESGGTEKTCGSTSQDHQSVWKRGV